MWNLCCEIKDIFMAYKDFCNDFCCHCYESLYIWKVHRWCIGTNEQDCDYFMKSFWDSFVKRLQFRTILHQVGWLYFPEPERTTSDHLYYFNFFGFQVGFKLVSVIVLGNMLLLEPNPAKLCRIGKNNIHI